MRQIMRENVLDFMEYYHSFQDSGIKCIHYDIYQRQIEIIIAVYWYDTNHIKDDSLHEHNEQLKMIFYNVDKFKCGTCFSSDIIENAYLDIIVDKDKEFFCFATDKVDPNLVIVCDQIKFLEMNMNHGNIDDASVLLSHIDLIHTTKMGEERIRRNLRLEDIDAVSWCRDLIFDTRSSFLRKGKNWYVTNGSYMITVNASSYTIITASIKK